LLQLRKLHKDLLDAFVKLNSLLENVQKVRDIVRPQGSPNSAEQSLKFPNGNAGLLIPSLGRNFSFLV